MRYWFTSDHHFGHRNIIKYCNRSFEDIAEMDEYMIKLWNQTVAYEDTVFHLGDFALPSKRATIKTAEDYIVKLNGNIIFLIGSHDSRKQVKSLIKNCTILYGGHTIFLQHEPTPVQLYNLCGHVHEKWKIQQLRPKKFVLNVGVDQWDYLPISIETILKAFKDFRSINQ